MMIQLAYAAFACYKPGNGNQVIDCGVELGQPAECKPWANRQSTNHARCHVPCKVYRGSQTVLMRVLSQDRRERFRPTCSALTMRHLLHLRSIPHVGDREK